MAGTQFAFGSPNVRSVSPSTTASHPVKATPAFVDTIHLAFRLSWTPDALAAVQRAAQIVSLRRDPLAAWNPDIDGPFTLGSRTYEPPRARARWYDAVLVSGDWTATVSTGVDSRGRPMPHPPLRLELRSVYLHHLGWHTAIQRAIDYAAELGTIHQITVTRADLACDILTDAVTPDLKEQGAFVSRARTATSHEVSITTETPLKTHYSSRRFTGWTIGSRGASAIHLRIYDKLLEIASNPAAAHIRDVWKHYGLPEPLPTDSKRIWRIEYEIGREPLAEFGYRDVSRWLTEGWAPLWATLTHEWFRVIDPTTSTRPSRAKTAPWWTTVQHAATDWQGDLATRDPIPLRPVDSRLLRQALGCMTRWAAAAGVSADDLIEWLATDGRGRIRILLEEAEARLSSEREAAIKHWRPRTELDERIRALIGARPSIPRAAEPFADA